MTNAKSTKRALLTSIFAILMCVAMLAGTTFAWFTDTASTGVNKIQAGNLDINVEYTLDGTNWAKLDEATDLFQKGLWEPGHTEIVGLKIKNAGNLALKYNISLNVVADNVGINKDGQEYRLSDYLKVKTYTMSASLADMNEYMSVINAFSIAFTSRSDMGIPYTDADFADLGALCSDAVLIPNKEDHLLLLKVYMPETVGNEANARSTEEAASIDFGINVVATQYTYESDSFNDQYDKNATYPVIDAAGLKDALKIGGNVTLANDVAVAPDVDTSVENYKLFEQMTVTKDTTIDLSGKKIAFDVAEGTDFAKACPLLMAVTDGTLTINGDGEINCDAAGNNAYGININGGNVVINGGKYYGAITAIQVQRGSLEINGGFFDMTDDCKATVPGYAKYIVNCIDQSYKDGTAKISVKGGTFVNFDPSDNPEGAETTYVADGYKVVSETQSNGDVWYTVVAE